MWKPISDLENLQFQDAHFHIDEKNPSSPIGVSLTARQPKEMGPKMTKLGTIAEPHIYPVTALKKQDGCVGTCQRTTLLFLANILKTYTLSLD
ncbi:hypothetical protein CLU79DRAFT_869768 [Phycomyces nitens]|nr:hypothetical protein CLU79DRAFT_869768 [Phycomyces nitens]